MRIIFDFPLIPGGCVWFLPAWCCDHSWSDACGFLLVSCRGPRCSTNVLIHIISYSTQIFLSTGGPGLQGAADRCTERCLVGVSDVQQQPHIYLLSFKWWLELHLRCWCIPSLLTGNNIHHECFSIPIFVPLLFYFEVADSPLCANELHLRLIISPSWCLKSVCFLCPMHVHLCTLASPSGTSAGHISFLF